MHIQSSFDSATAAVPKSGNGVPLIAHVIYRFGVGGLENGLVNLINRIPAERFRHAIVCLTDYSEAFRQRLRRTDVPIFALNKPPGNNPGIYFQLWRLFQKLQPDIVHTRNLAALEATLPAAFVGVTGRIHGEHGRDVEDLDGSSRKYQLWRRVFKSFVHQYIVLSKDLERYLLDQVGVSPNRIAHIYNGVDTDLFRPAIGGREPLPCPGFAPDEAFVIGTVGRMQAVKDPVTLARAFIAMRQLAPPGGRPLRLVMVGEGPLRTEVAKVLERGGAREAAWIPGERSDIPRIMRGLDLFVLPSLAEGVSNTILEAMASGLPVAATAVGGNPELVQPGRTGQLLSPADSVAMAHAMLRYYLDEAECRRQSREARLVAERCFNMAAMVDRYLAIYDGVLKQRGRAGVSSSCAES